MCLSLLDVLALEEKLLKQANRQELPKEIAPKSLTALVTIASSALGGAGKTRRSPLLTSREQQRAASPAKSFQQENGRRENRE